MDAWRRVFGALKPLFFLLLMAGAAAIAAASLVYFGGDDLPPFAIEKLPLPHEDLWLFALRVHVATAVFALPACLMLTVRVVLRTLPSLHRWLGRATGVVTLFALVPSGLYLSLFAKGGLPSTLGFALSGLIVAYAMVRGIQRARAHRYAEHRRFVLHVLAQLSVAVTSRAMLFGFHALGVEAELAYIVALWIPVVVSAGAVEVFTRVWIPLHTRRQHARSHGSQLRAGDVQLGVAPGV